MGKHWVYNDNEDIVVSHLRALAHSNPSVKLIQEDKIIYNPKSTSGKKVTLVSGGGAGHEPMHAAYVGDNLLDAAVSGNIFASPSTKQIMAAIRKVSSKDKEDGTLVIVKNYTGDILHFGLVVERAKAEGYNVEMLAVTDDVAVSREQNKMVGRRGLAGTALVHKILGGAAATSNSLKEVVELGEQINANLVTLGASLDRTSVPGRNAEEADDESTSIGSNEAELGLGIHNEPGHKLSPIPKIDNLITEMFEKLVSPNDKDRHYVDFDLENDEYVLLVNNIGGTSTLELYAVADHILSNLPFKKKPTRILISDFVTSLNAPGFSITLLNLTKAATGKFDQQTILKYLDTSTNAPGWKPKTYSSEHWSKKIEIEPSADHKSSIVRSDVKVDSKLFQKAIESGLNKVLEEEPKITKYDTLVGDGDCGETLAAGAKSILGSIKDGSLVLDDPVAAASQITELVEDSMGGTSGGIYSILLTALVKSLKNVKEYNGKSIGEALHEALYDGLFKYTKARVGGRTLVDTLQPFVDTLAESGDLSKAIESAKKGCEDTRKLKAKFGRASYVDDEDIKADGGIPDPGAVGILAILEGFANGLNE